MAGAGAGNGGTCCRCLCGFLVSIGVAVLIYWATYQPHRIRAAVDFAELSNLTVVERNDGGGGGVVYYRLSINVTLHNPSGRVGVYYDAIDARLLLAGDGASLGPANATSPEVFHQPRMSTAVVTIEFDRSGGGGVGVAGDVAAELDKEIKGGGGGDGVVGFELALDARVRYKLGFVPIRARPKVRCPMRIPVKAGRHRRSGVGGVLSSGNRCTVKY
uniref:Late embryogenesis abundant protein LEA-2 subgroup domain-containing protein n=1 Tax=Oryza punctata TaxID=4537 RepID=A0A0E0MJV8_ORYPU